MVEADRSVYEAWDGRLSGDQVIVDAVSASDLSPRRFTRYLSLLTAIEGARLGGD